MYPRKSEAEVKNKAIRHAFNKVYDKIFSSAIDEYTIKPENAGKDVYEYAEKYLIRKGLKKTDTNFNARKNDLANELIALNGKDAKYTAGSKIKYVKKTLNKATVNQLRSVGFGPNEANQQFFARFNYLEPKQQQNVIAVLKHCKAKGITEPQKINAEIVKYYPEIQLFETDMKVLQKPTRGMARGYMARYLLQQIDAIIAMYHQVATSDQSLKTLGTGLLVEIQDLLHVSTKFINDNLGTCIAEGDSRVNLAPMLNKLRQECLNLVVLADMEEKDKDESFDKKKHIPGWAGSQFDKQFKELFNGQTLNYDAVVTYLQALQEYQKAPEADRNNKNSLAYKKIEQATKALNQKIPNFDSVGKRIEGWSKGTSFVGGLVDLGVMVGMMYMSGGTAAIGRSAMYMGNGARLTVGNAVGRLAISDGSKFIMSEGAAILTSMVTSSAETAAFFQTTKVLGAIEDGQVTRQEVAEIQEGFKGLFKFSMVGSAIAGPIGNKVAELTSKALNSEPMIARIMQTAVEGNGTSLDKVLKALAENSEAISKITEFGTSFSINAGYLMYDENEQIRRYNSTVDDENLKQDETSYFGAMGNLGAMDAVSKLVVAMLGGKNMAFLTPRKIQQIKTSLAGYDVKLTVFKGQKIYEVTDKTGTKTRLANEQELFMFIVDREVSALKDTNLTAEMIREPNVDITVVNDGVKEDRLGETQQTAGAERVVSAKCIEAGNKVFEVKPDDFAQNPAKIKEVQASIDELRKTEPQRAEELQIVLDMFKNPTKDVDVTDKQIDAVVSFLMDHYASKEAYLSEQVKGAGLDKLGSFKYRLKGEASTRDKVANYLKDAVKARQKNPKKPVKTLLDAYNDVRDKYACRTVFEKFKLDLPKFAKEVEVLEKEAESLHQQGEPVLADLKTTEALSRKELIKLIKEADALKAAGKIHEAEAKMHEACKRAAEIQSEKALETLMEDMTKAKEGNNDLAAIRISNYTSENGIPIFSERQLELLQKHGAKLGLDVSFIKLAKEVNPNAETRIVDGATTKAQPSGYTALQVNFVTKAGEIIEWQFRGKLVDIFAEAEHLPYDLRTGKRPWAQYPELEPLYKPIADLLREKDMPKHAYKQLNKYFTDYYTHLRKLELGFESKEPRLEDYENYRAKDDNGVERDFSFKFDKRLEAKNLMHLHDIAEAVKNYKKYEGLKQKEAEGKLTQEETEELSKLANKPRIAPEKAVSAYHKAIGVKLLEGGVLDINLDAPVSYSGQNFKLEVDIIKQFVDGKLDIAQAVAVLRNPAKLDAVFKEAEKFISSKTKLEECKSQISEELDKNIADHGSIVMHSAIDSSRIKTDHETGIQYVEMTRDDIMLAASVPSKNSEKYIERFMKASENHDEEYVSLSLINKNSDVFYHDSKYGVVAKPKSINVTSAGFGQKSGFGKGEESFVWQNSLKYGQNEPDSIYLHNALIKNLKEQGVSLSDKDYVDLFKQICEKETFDEINEDVTVNGKIIKATILREAVEKAHCDFASLELSGMVSNNEVTSIVDNIEAVYARVNSINEIDPAVLEVIKKYKAKVYLLGEIQDYALDNNAEYQREKKLLKQRMLTKQITTAQWFALDTELKNRYIDALRSDLKPRTTIETIKESP